MEGVRVCWEVDWFCWTSQAYSGPAGWGQSGELRETERKKGLGFNYFTVWFKNRNKGGGVLKCFSNCTTARQQSKSLLPQCKSATDQWVAEFDMFVKGPHAHPSACYSVQSVQFDWKLAAFLDELASILSDIPRCRHSARRPSAPYYVANRGKNKFSASTALVLLQWAWTASSCKKTSQWQGRDPQHKLYILQFCSFPFKM